MREDLETEAVKQEFRRRWIRQLVVSVIVVAALLLSGAFSREHVSGAVIPPYIFVAVVVGLLAFSLFNWRCPACKRYLGKVLYPRHCSGCGVQLR